MQINPKDMLDLQKISVFLNLDTQTQTEASALFEKFQENSKYLNLNFNFNPQISLACAVLIACKTQKITNLEGEEKRGVGISFTHMIKYLKSLDENFNVIQMFLMTLDTFLNSMIIDDTSQQELKEIICKFKFLQKLFYKYEELFSRIGVYIIEEKMNEKIEIINNIKCIGWLIFSLIRRNHYENDQDIIPNYCLLLSVIYFIIQGLANSQKCMFLGELPKDENESHENFSLRLRNKLCEIINLKNLEQFELIFLNSEKEALKIIQENTLRTQDSEKSSFKIFQDEIMNLNYMKLDSALQKQIKNLEDIDERCFLTQKKSFTPMKFTPFVKQVNPNKFFKTPAIPSCKSLNYELTQKLSEKSNLMELKMSRLQSPLINKPVFNPPPATPMTAAVELNNWLYDMNKKLKFTIDEKKTDEKRIVTLIEKIMDRTMIFDKKARCEQVFSIYLFVLEKIKPIDEDEISFKNSILACSFEVIFYILNNSDISLELLIELCETDPYFFWTKIRVFIEMVFFLPTILKENFYEIEKIMLMKFVWVKGSHISNIVTKFLQKITENDENIDKKEKKITNVFNTQEEFFFKRVLHLSALQIQELIESFKFENSVGEMIWTLMKEILSCETSLLIDKNIIQFIFCSFYSICKIFLAERNLTFQEIILNYMNLPNNKKNAQLILFSKNDKGEKINVIDFYNKIFLPEIKPILKTMRENPNNTLIFKPKIPLLNIMSPLKQSISKQNIEICLSPCNQMMTPLSSALFVQNDKFFQSVSKLDLLNNNSNRPNSLLLDRIKSKELKTPVFSIKNNQKENEGNELLSKRVIQFENLDMIKKKIKLSENI